MENQHVLMPVSKLVHYLRMHCHAGMTGAFYIATDQGHWGEFLLEKGKIVGIRYRALRGIKALQLLRRSAKQGKYSFNTDGLTLEGSAKDGEVLPETEKVLQFLARPPSPEADTKPPSEAGGTAARTAQNATAAAAQRRTPAARPAPAGSAPSSRPQPSQRTPAPPPSERVQNEELRRRQRIRELHGRAGVERRNERAAPPPPSGDKLVAAYTVLVVEDSIISRKVITNTLVPRGYRITEAGDGFQALAQLSNEKPDLVLLDLILPGMDGYKVLSHMKKKPEFAAIPVIILTSRDTLFDKLKGKMSGSDEYLTKPFSSVELVDKVAKYLK